MNEKLAKIIGPKIVCPGATQEQISQFLRKNNIFFGIVTLETPTQLSKIEGVTAFSGNISVKGGRVDITGTLIIGSKLNIE